MDRSKIKIIYRDITQLKESDYNPRKINAKQKEQLIKSIKDFGFIDPVIVNKHSDRNDIIVGGSQRVKAARLIGLETVPTVEVELDAEKEKELNLRLNKNGGEFDQDILRELFEKDFLMSVGFSDKEVKNLENDFDRKFNSITNDTAEMPVVPKFSERYDSILIFSDNELDFNWLKNVLEVQRKKDYKNTVIGDCLVLTVKEFQTIWEKNMPK